MAKGVLMHELRSAILSGEGATASVVSTKESCRRRGGKGGLAALHIERGERRSTDQRAEDRHWGVVERAMLVFRRKRRLVRVINLSTGGMTIECEIMPRIGELVGIEFEGFDPVDGIVRWVKQGRIGLDLGEGGISLEG
ncbi:MAG TPA: PilZ domain-containing protein [Allosphingosinicella sp.]